MLKSFDTVKKAMRTLIASVMAQRTILRVSAATLAAGTFVVLGGLATGAITAFGPINSAAPTAAPTPITAPIAASPEVEAVKAIVKNKVRARSRAANQNVDASLKVLPAVRSDMSEQAFYAVVDNAVQIAGDDYLAEPFAGLSLTQLDRERTCLAQAIYFEARSEGPLGKLAVAEVVLTRVADKRYPGTICGVVFQGSQLQSGCQFSWTCDGLRDTPAETGAWAKSEALASYVTLDVEWEEVTGKATHYHAEYVSPYWAPSLEEVAQVGKHVFYRWTARNGLRDS